MNLDFYFPLGTLWSNDTRIILNGFVMLFQGVLTMMRLGVNWGLHIRDVNNIDVSSKSDVLITDVDGLELLNTDDDVIDDDVADDDIVDDDAIEDGATEDDATEDDVIDDDDDTTEEDVIDDDATEDDVTLLDDNTTVVVAKNINLLNRGLQSSLFLLRFLYPDRKEKKKIIIKNKR